MLCYRKCLVVKKFMEKKGEGECPNFPSKLFCLKVQKHFVEGPSCAVLQKISGGEKVFRKEADGSIEIFRRNFLSQSAETFRRGNLYSFIHFVYRINLCFRGFCHVFPSKTFCLTVLKNIVWEPFTLSFISGIGYVTIIRRKVFV